MITQGARITGLCPECRATLVYEVGQWIERGVLWWGSEGGCGRCAHGRCERNQGPVVTPEWVRQALLTAHGAARLSLADARTGLVPVLRALRAAEDLTIAAARARAAELAGTGLVGTLVEMESLARALRDRGVAVAVGPAAGTPRRGRLRPPDAVQRGRNVEGG
ncbi:hypothetical protein E3E14_22535 [Streptomyces sp. ICN441]|uniref:hypothetical protein n=1 Tax=Streptomyces sp. ICN441 TaxID=2558286 RepID=UPI001069AC80|nr:hypothetical protein [Streptomyces sp. ICN441]TFE43374.1 hypothetical protein E3E14_22535 [Streptomyces sp. ICN441]